MKNYFHFKKLKDLYLLTNDLGRYLFADEDQFQALLKDSVDPDSEFGRSAIDGFFCYSGSKQAFSDAMSSFYREKKNYLFGGTSLHIFVVTNACNLACVYCQAQNGIEIPNGFMQLETAKKAVDLALSSPNNRLTFEFQGGEPLLNFEAIRYIVLYTEERLQQCAKQVEFNIVSNLTLLSEEILAFLREHNVGISTSLDGSQLIHNTNRPLRTGEGSYDSVLRAITLLNNQKIPFGAIQTTTAFTLDKAKELVDSYVELGLSSIFIRSLTPLGRASKDLQKIGYTPAAFLHFYRECLLYILRLNLEGIHLKEGHAAIMLSKILSDYPVNYMELRSPCGAAIGQIAYYYNGNVYTCDEGRMLAEMGDDAFRLGTVDDTYDSLMDSSVCKSVCIASSLESLPNCQDCVYQPYCGTCPVVHYAQTGDIMAKTPNDYRCQIYKGMFDLLFELLQDKAYEAIFKTWL